MENQSLSHPTIPDLTPEQAENTKAFLDLVADCMGTHSRCLIMRENILTRDTYKQKRNPETGKLEPILDNYGEKTFSGHKGVNWAKPAIYEVARHNDLLYEHDHCYRRKKVVDVKYWNWDKRDWDWRKEKRYIPPVRPSLIQTVIESSSTKKYLFLPVLLKDGESQRKDGRYQFRYTDLDGSRRYIYNMDLHELRKEAAEILQTLNQGVSYRDGCAPLCVLIDRMFQLKRTWSDSTRETMEYYLVTMRKSILYEMPINKIKMSDIKAYLVTLHDEGYAYGTIASIFTILKLSFRLAIEDNAIVRDPANFPISDILKNDTPPVKALTQEQVQHLLQFLQNDTIGCRHLDMVVILLGTGLRISEFAALTIYDIDFERNIIHVDKQLKKLKGKTVIDRPKTSNAIRNIPMTQAVRESLQRLVNAQHKGPKSQTLDGVTDFLSVTRNGRPKNHSEYADSVRAFMVRYNEQAEVPIERCTPHVLRHTYCTRCISAGMDLKSVQYLMGHADASTTLNIYADVVFDKVVENVELLKPYSK